MTKSDRNARTGILSLLADLPDDVAAYWRTADELAELLRRGGASTSLKSDLVQKALQYAPPTFKEKYDEPRREVISTKQRTDYRFIRSNDASSPASQRAGGASLPTVEENYFHDRPSHLSHRDHLMAISVYYGDTARTADADPPSSSSSDVVHIADGLRVVEIRREREMFRALHAHHCGIFGAELIIYRDDPNHGFGMIDYLRCSGCRQEWVYRTYDEAYPKIKADATKCFRKAPTMNSAIVEAFIDTGAWPTAVWKACGKAGINAPALTCMKKIEKRTRVAALSTGAKCIESNRKDAVAAAVEKIEFDDEDGHHSAAVLTIAQDGTGPKRFYMCRCTGTGHMQVALCRETGQIVAIRCDQTSCVNCSRAWGDAVKKAGADGVEVSPASVAIEHEGMCYRTSSDSPSTAEEFAAGKIGRDLLATPDGKVRPDDEAIFIGTGVSDGDSKAVRRAAKEQAKIVGDVAISWQAYCQDWSHQKKNIGKSLHEAKKNGYGGKKVGLTTPRILAIEHDVEDCTRRYKERAIDPAGVSDEDRDKYRTTYLDELAAIVPHHCGIHTNCTVEMCGAKRILRDNPGISMEELVKRYDASTRFRGQILSVTEEGVKELSSFITKRITAKNADSIARMESTGKIESSNAEAVVLTGGKRLNMTQTNAYVTVWNRVVGHQRLGKEYELTQMDLLGVFPTPLREKKVAEIAHKQEMSRKRKSKKEYKDEKKRRKAFAAAMEETRIQGKGERRYSKNKDCGSGPLANDKSKKRPTRCGACGEIGHTRRTCQIFPYEKNCNKKKAGSGRKRKANSKEIPMDDVDAYIGAAYREQKNKKRK